MSRLIKIAWLSMALILIGLAACGGATPTTDPSLAYTQIWKTVEVAQSQTALASSPTPSLTETPAISPTPEASNTPLLTSTPLTAGPTNTPFSISTTKPLVTQSTACDNANFVSDVNFPDGSEVVAGAPFVKTWSFKNLGPCTWTTKYHIVYSYVSDTGKNGVFTAPSPAAFPAKVLPGDSVELSVTLKAPSKAGTYQVWFVLQNENGYNIPLVNESMYEFWVLFVVK